MLSNESATTRPILPGRQRKPAGLAAVALSALLALAFASHACTRQVPENSKGDGGKKVLVIDIGGTSIKFLCNGQTEPRRFPARQCGMWRC